MFILLLRYGRSEVYSNVRLFRIYIIHLVMDKQGDVNINNNNDQEKDENQVWH